MTTIRKLTTFRGWLHGLVAAVIGGTASAGLTYLTMNGAAAQGLDVPVLNFKALGIILLASGLVNMFAYLKQSPLPDTKDDVNDMPAGGPVAALLVSLSLCAITLLGTTGCVSTGVKPQTVDTAAAAVRPVAKNVVNLVLQKNPKYDGALLALAAGAEAALNGGELTVEAIRSFVDALSSKYDLDAQTRITIASAIDDIATLYRDTYGRQVVDSTDPNVKRILTAFAQGIREGVAFYRALSSP